MNNSFCPESSAAYKIRAFQHLMLDHNFKGCPGLAQELGGSVPDVFGQIKVLMLYTPFPPETASIFAMLQFLQSLGCSVHTEMHIYIYIFMAYIYIL